MKNKIYVMLSFMILCMLITGCTDNTTGDAPQAGLPADTPQTAVLDEEPPEPGDTSGPGSRRTPEERKATPVDVDLTVLSTTLLSAEMNNIYSNGEDFVGKKIRVKGTYDYMTYEGLDIQYHYILTQQGDACCQEGFEIIRNGDYVFPDDYPKLGTPIEVDGVFGIYQDDEYLYYYLAIDDIFILG